MIPLWSVPSSTSSSARIIPSETSPRTLRRSSCSPFGSTAPGQRDGDGRAGAEVPGAADDLARLALAHVDRGRAGAGRRSGASPPRAPCPTRKRPRLPSVVGDAAALDPLDLGGRDREPRRELVERHLERRRTRAARRPGRSSELPQDAEVALPERRGCRGCRAAAARCARARSRTRSRDHSSGSKPTFSNTRGSTMPGAAHLDPARVACRCGSPRRRRSRTRRPARSTAR